MNTPMLPGLIDRMIGLAHDHEPAASYRILAGLNPTIGADWIAGKKVYSFFPVAQSRFIPDDLVVLAPAPDNTRLGALREFHGDLSTGQVTEASTPVSEAPPMRAAADSDLGTHLRPLVEEQYPEWLDRSRTEYVHDLIKAGRTPNEAEKEAAQSMLRLFPGGAPSENHAVFDVIDSEDTTIGYLWIGPDLSGDKQAWWVWDIVIDPEHRGRGLGREAMLLGEEYARAQGARTLGLNVFGFNTTARHLYETLGYEMTSIRMRKRLTHT